MPQPVWVEKQALLVLHSRSIALHGGVDGLRDEGLLDSALHRPANRFNYDDVDDLAELAATYAVGVASNHPFIDGNKRAAFQSAALFLRLNGSRLTADRVEATKVIFAVAAGRIDIKALAGWLRENCTTDQR